MQPGRPAGPQSPALSAALSRAVDLSALKARSEAQQRPEHAAGQRQSAAGDAGEAPAGDYVIDVSEATFQTEVLDRSFQVPVVLDLWAEWCGPCKQLSPVLEKLAAEGGGSWVLAKIDVDANPAIAQALRVQGIPAVKAVFQGQLIGEFTGAIPEPQVRQFVSALVEATGGAPPSGPEAGAPAGAQAAAPAGNGAEPASEPEDPRVGAAEDAVARGDLDEAARLYQAILAAEPSHARAAEALREVELLRRAESAPPDAVARANRSPDEVDAQLTAADIEAASGQVEAALARLLETVRRSGGADRDRARTRLLELFELIGPDDPRVAAARRELSRALF
jgi:putative thioredoxin